MEDEASVQHLVWVRKACTSGLARSLRLGAGLSLREVAQPLNVSPTTVQRWEEGVSRPTGPRAVGYARLLERLARPELVAS